MIMHFISVTFVWILFIHLLYAIFILHYSICIGDNCIAIHTQVPISPEETILLFIDVDPD